MSVQGLSEKRMEQWLADNPTAVLPEGEERVLVISQETPFENVTDIIAIDQEGNLVVTEVKRGQTPRDVIAQTLEYASDAAEWSYELLNRRALQYFAKRNVNYNSLLEAFCDTFGVAPGDIAESGFNQAQRIFIVGEQIDEKVERAARWLLKRGVPISCLSYTCYTSDEQERFLNLQEVVRAVEGVAPRSGTTQPIKPEDLPEGLRRVFLELRDNVGRFGKDVQTPTTRDNFIFKANRNFAEIHFKRRAGCLDFYVRPEGFDIPEKRSAQVHGLTVTRVPDSHGWPLSHWFRVDENSDLDAVEMLLRQSYSAVHGKAPTCGSEQI